MNDRDESGLKIRKRMRGFLLLQALLGLVSITAFLSLPGSEQGAAVWLGLSLFRLIALFGLLALDLCLWTLFIFSLARRAAFDNNLERLSDYFQKNDLLLASIYSLTFLSSLALFSLEVVLNPAVFPRAVYYIYIYVRLRPISLWLAVLFGSVFILIRGNIWKGGASRPLKKKTCVWTLAIICISWTGMIFQWVRYWQAPKHFVNYRAANITLLILSLAGILLSIFISERAFHKNE
jgi:hypothetical protein